MNDPIFGRATVYWDTGCSATFHNFEAARKRVLERFNSTENLQRGPATIKRPHTAEVLERIAGCLQCGKNTAYFPCGDCVAKAEGF